MAFNRIVVLLCCALMICAVVSAQTSSIIRGTVNDSTGAVIAGAEMVLTDIETNVQRRTISNEAGNYEIPDLKRGTYRLESKVSGFKTFKADDLILESAQIRRLDVTLEVGDTASEVTVQAMAAVINPEEGKLTASITSKNYQFSAPSGIDRFNPSMFLVTLPNIAPSQNGGHDWSIAGTRSSQIEEGMDGAPTQGTVNQIHNMEDVEEVKIVTVNNSAEHPRAGYFNLVGKRGYNAYHGTAVYYVENSALNARDFFDPQRVPQKFHIFGGSASGKILKDRTFFYTSYNGIRDPSKSYILTNAPTEKMRAGDFSQLLNQARPTVIRDPLTNQPFPNNIIPPTRLSSVPLQVQQKYIPGPNRGSSDELNQNLSILHPYPQDLYKIDYYSARVDHEFSPSNQFYYRILNRWTPYVLPRTWPGLAWTRNRYAFHQVFSDTHVFSPTTVLSTRFGWYLNKVVDGNTVDGFTPAQGDQVVRDLGIQGVNPRGLSAMGFPEMNITGYTALNLQPGGTAQNDDDYNVAATLTKLTAKHSLKIGFDYRRYKGYNDIVPNGTYGSFAFTGSFSGYGYSDFLLGLPQSSTRVDPLVDRTRHSSELGLFIDDTWKVSNKLTLTLGIRWDYFGPARYDDDLQYNWDPATGNVIVPENVLNRISPLYPVNTIRVAAGDAVVNPDMRNFAPRLGGAYRINDRTVIRGGYGVFTEFLGQFTFSNTGGPFQLAETFINTVNNGVPLFQFPNAFPAGSGNIPSQSVTGFPTDAKNGYIQQFNVTLERQIRQTGFRFSYIGTRGKGLNYNLNINKPQPSLTTFTQAMRPYPNLIGATIGLHDGQTKYDSLSVEAVQKVGAVTFNANWTWGNSMADFLNLENPYNHYLWNRDGLTPRHRFVGTAFWQLPIGRGKQLLGRAPRPVEIVLGNWMLSWQSVFQTGMFFSPSYSGSDPSNTNTVGGNPDRIADGNLPPGQRTVQRWFDTNAFVAPPPGRFGNSGLFILEGPGRNLHHLSLAKTFKFTERFSFDLMGAATNLFNHPHFAFPNANVSVPSGGVITTAYSYFGADKAAARRLEIRGRINW